MTVQDEHIEAIRRWRNEQIDVLRQSHPISPEEQVAYYAARIWPLLESPEPSDVLVAFLESDRLVGYGGLVHISWPNRRAEVSFLMDPDVVTDRDEAYPRYFAAYLGLIEELAFRDLGLHRLYAETWDVRPLHIATLESCRFVLEGRLIDHVFINGRPTDAVIHGLIDFK